MSPTSWEPFLMEHKLFRWLDLRYVSFVANCASHRKYERVEALLERGKKADRFFIIIRGKVGVQISNGGQEPIVVQTLSDGDVLGWSGLFPPYCGPFTATADELTQTLVLDAETIRARCEEDHDPGFERMRRFSPVIVDRLSAERQGLRHGLEHCHAPME